MSKVSQPGKWNSTALARSHISSLWAQTACWCPNAPKGGGCRSTAANAPRATSLCQLAFTEQVQGAGEASRALLLAPLLCQLGRGSMVGRGGKAAGLALGCCSNWAACQQQATNPHPVEARWPSLLYQAAHLSWWCSTKNENWSKLTSK